MTVGEIIYHFYHKPVGMTKNVLKIGIRKTVEIKRGKKKMIEASRHLREIRYNGIDQHNVYFLTGKKYWYQTAFCLYSLQLRAGMNIHATVLDDGSFDDELEADVNKQFPTTVTVIRTDRLNRLLDEKLPKDRFPELRNRRLVYPHLRKLTDIHVLPSRLPKLVLDSDMLFFQKPNELLDWLSNPSRLLFMRDVKESYGYTRALMKKLAVADVIPERLNVGIAGIPSDKINWQRLEQWTGELLRQEGSSYLQEQALTAMLAANHPVQFLDERDYKVLPLIKNGQVDEVLHHYVADSKYDYFVKGWKIVFDSYRNA